MYEVKITDIAKTEIVSICSYLENTLHSNQAKENFVAELNSQVDILSEFPEIYAISQRPEINKINGRVAPVNDYALVYIVDKTEVIVLHIFHSLQDYGRLVLR